VIYFYQRAVTSNQGAVEINIKEQIMTSHYKSMLISCAVSFLALAGNAYANGATFPGGGNSNNNALIPHIAIPAANANVSTPSAAACPVLPSNCQCVGGHPICFAYDPTPTHTISPNPPVCEHTPPPVGYEWLPLTPGLPCDQYHLVRK
jgi:hypothetical protein